MDLLNKDMYYDKKTGEIIYIRHDIAFTVPADQYKRFFLTKNRRFLPAVFLPFLAALPHYWPLWLAGAALLYLACAFVFYFKMLRRYEKKFAAQAEPFPFRYAEHCRREETEAKKEGGRPDSVHKPSPRLAGIAEILLGILILAGLFARQGSPAPGYQAASAVLAVMAVALGIKRLRKSLP